MNTDNVRTIKAGKVEIHIQPVGESVFVTVEPMTDQGLRSAIIVPLPHRVARRMADELHAAAGRAEHSIARLEPRPGLPPPG